MSTKAIQNTIIGLVFATLIIPFVVMNGAYFPYIFGKAMLFRSLVLVALVFWSVLIYKDSRFFPSKSCVTWSLLAFTGFLLLSAFLGPDTRESIFNNFERMDGWVTTAFLFAFFLITTSVMREKKHWNRFFVVQICSSIILLLIGSKELIEGGVNIRIDATLGNPIYLAIILMFSIFFALYLLFEDYSKGAKIFFASTIVLNIFGIFFTGTRGAMVGVFISGVLLMIYFAIKNWSNHKVKAFSVSFLILAILIPVLLFSAKDSDFVKSNSTLTRITEINFDQGTGYARFVNWGIALDGIKERPLIGWGQGNYIYVYDKHYDPRMYAQEPYFDRAHNIILDTLIHGGILTLLSYLSILFFALYYLFKNQELKSEQKFIVAGLLLAYFIQNLFVFDNIISFFLFMMILSFSVYYKERVPMVKENDVAKFSIIGVASVFVLFGIVYAVYFPWVSNTSLLKGMQVVTQDGIGNSKMLYPNGVADNQKFFENALKNSSTGVQEIKIATFQVSSSLIKIQTDNEKIKADIENFINFAQQELINETEYRPKSARVLYIASAFSMLIDDALKAEEFIQRAVDISPNRQIYLDRLATIKKVLEKPEEEFEIRKRIYELEKTNDGAWLDYSNLLAQRDQQAYLDLLAEVKDGNRLQKVISIFDNVIEKTKDQPQAYVNKVVILAKFGMFEESIIALDVVDEKFPELIPQTKIWRANLLKGQLPQ